MSDNTLRPGTTLNKRYQIEAIIGTGGMSVVYSALDLNFRFTERRCAIKEMFDSLTDPLVRKRARESFEREANLLVGLNKLNSQYIPQVYDFFEQDNRHYLVYELIPGKDLARYLHQGARPVSPDKVVDWAIQLTDVLAKLHESNPPIIFRDLKPSNVMLKPDGQIVLIDFGIAKNFQEEKGTIIGTEGYAPPEQYEGIADALVDIYALGATMHHLLTNTDPQNFRPFSSHKRPIPQYNSAVPDELTGIVMRALSYNTEDRWQSMVELRQALKRVQQRFDSSEERVVAGAESKPLRSPRGTGLLNRLRKKEQVNTGAVHNGPEPQKNKSSSSGWQRVAPTPAAQVRLDDGTQPVGASSRATNDNTKPVGLNFTVQERQASKALPPSGTIGLDGEPSTELQVTPLWIFTAEDEIRSTPCLTEDSVYIGCYDTNLYCLDRATGHLRWKFATQGGIASTPAIAGELVVVGSDDGQIYAINRHSGKLEWTKQTQAPVRSSPHIIEGSLFIGSDDSNLYALNIATGHVRWKTHLFAPIRSTAVSHNDLLVIGTEEGIITGINIQTGETTWRVYSEAAVISCPVLAGLNVIAGSLDRQLCSINLRSGWVTWRKRLAERIYSSLAVANEKLYVCTVDGTIYCLELDEGREIWKSTLKTLVTSSPFITQQGMLYVGGKDGALYCIETKKGQIRWRFQTGGPIPGSPRVWEPDRVIYVGSMDHKLYALPVK